MARSAAQGPFGPRARVGVSPYAACVRLRATDLADVLAYLVVLGLFIQLFPEVISESFVLALLTAILLKVVLEIVLAVKKRVVGRLRSATSLAGRVVGVATLLLVLPGSKLLVLELTSAVFGGAVRRCR